MVHEVEIVNCSVSFPVMHRTKPKCSIKSKRESGSYGQPHLVKLCEYTGEYSFKETVFKVMVPYRDGEFISWVDSDGSVYYDEGNDSFGGGFVSRSWVSMRNVSEDVLDFLNLRRNYFWKRTNRAYT